MPSDLEKAQDGTVSSFYDEFADQQVQTGINLRHYSIMRALVKLGLKKHHSVLEIGCGVGTLTTLLMHFLGSGQLVATDISARSVEIAKTRVPRAQKVHWLVTDMQDFEWDASFDFIVLPDVLEHIPLDQHSRLFARISAVMHDESVLFIHIPHPSMIAYLQKHDPASLQVVDQSIHADELLRNAYGNGLQLDKYEAYRLFSDVPDYCKISFVKSRKYTAPASVSKGNIIYRKAILRLRHFVSRF